MLRLGMIVALALLGGSTLYQIIWHINGSVTSSDAIKCTGTGSSNTKSDAVDDPRYPPNASTKKDKDNTATGIYKASAVERYMLDHAAELGLNDINRLHSTCRIWNDPQHAPLVYSQLQHYLVELDEYNRRFSQHAIVPDIRRQWIQNVSLSREDVCRQLDLHPKGVAAGIFPKSKALSYTASGGPVEPLLPPMRDPHFCTNNATKVAAVPNFRNSGVSVDESMINEDFLLYMGYLVHDLSVVCRSPTYTTASRNILIDMGASLEYHHLDDNVDIMSFPAIYLLELFRKFGLPFDHVYAYEATQIAAQYVYSKVPPQHVLSYHWINFPVSTDKNDAKQNPLTMLLNGGFTKDDLIVVKLDVDNTPIELSLIQQVLDDERYHTLIDHLYFEYHVRMNELAPFWAVESHDSVETSLHLFTKLRQVGIAAHFWP